MGGIGVQLAEKFPHILQASLAPLAFVSATGLLLLSITNRFMHALDRGRDFLRMLRRMDSENEERVVLLSQIQFLHGRLRSMRSMLACSLCSLFFAGLASLNFYIEEVFESSFGFVSVYFMAISLALFTLSLFLYLRDILASLTAFEMDFASVCLIPEIKA